MYERGGFDIFSLTYSHATSLIKLLQKYQDLPMDLADASLVILAEELNCGDIVSTDERDFETYKWKSKHPFNNIFSAKNKKNFS